MVPPPLHLRRYLSFSAPRLRPRPRPAPPLPFPCSSATSPKRSAPRASAPTTTPRRHLHMADDAVAGSGAAVHCARPAPAPAPLLPSSARMQQVDDGGCGSSDGHQHYYQQDVIMLRRTRSGRAFPPPISVIGKGGRPWLSLRAHREGGRLVLREMRLPSQELLQPCKEDGRFKLLIHPEAARAARGSRAGAAAPQERQGKDEQCS